MLFLQDADVDPLRITTVLDTVPVTYVQKQVKKVIWRL